MEQLFAHRRIFQRSKSALEQTSLGSQFQRYDLESTSRVFGKLACSDWHDKVYALLGLSASTRDIKPFGVSYAEGPWQSLHRILESLSLDNEGAFIRLFIDRYRLVMPGLGNIPTMKLQLGFYRWPSEVASIGVKSYFNWQNTSIDPTIGWQRPLQVKTAPDKHLSLFYVSIPLEPVLGEQPIGFTPLTDSVNSDLIAFLHFGEPWLPLTTSSVQGVSLARQESTTLAETAKDHIHDFLLRLFEWTRSKMTIALPGADQKTQKVTCCFDLAAYVALAPLLADVTDRFYDWDLHPLAHKCNEILALCR